MYQRLCFVMVSLSLYVKLIAGGRFSQTRSHNYTEIPFQYGTVFLLAFLILSLSDVAVGGDVEVTFEVTPRKMKSTRRRTLIITCQSKQLKGIMGTAAIMVKA